MTSRRNFLGALALLGLAPQALAQQKKKKAAKKKAETELQKAGPEGNAEAQAALQRAAARLDVAGKGKS